MDNNNFSSKEIQNSLNEDLSKESTQADISKVLPMILSGVYKSSEEQFNKLGQQTTVNAYGLASISKQMTQLSQIVKQLADKAGIQGQVEQPEASAPVRPKQPAQPKQDGNEKLAEMFAELMQNRNGNDQQ
ncbi:hypothetical protein MHBO_001420 [Bonamia ostreae]|uniref:Uncharacterized protein n=1 Tax=Bonamia ostreae TaxID=126728 RepID=A0ABV2AIX7_9EUKA